MGLCIRNTTFIFDRRQRSSNTLGITGVPVAMMPLNLRLSLHVFSTVYTFAATIPNCLATFTVKVNAPFKLGMEHYMRGISPLTAFCGALTQQLSGYPTKFPYLFRCDLFHDECIFFYEMSRQQPTGGNTPTKVGKHISTQKFGERDVWRKLTGVSTGEGQTRKQIQDCKGNAQMQNCQNLASNQHNVCHCFFEMYM